MVDRARAAFADGDYRWAAEVVNHVVFAEPEHAGARELLADVFEQLGYGSENGTWRNFFLSGTTELRSGRFGTPTESAVPDVISQLTPAMLFDAMAIQVDGPRAWHEELAIDVVLTDSGERYRLRLANGVLSYSARPQRGDPDVTITTTRPVLPALVLGGLSADGLASAGIDLAGDPGVLGRLAAVLDPGDKDFAIVTPT